MDAYPMIVQCMFRQCEEYGYFACQICGHEVTKNDVFDTMLDCGWCGHERIQPIWLTPRREGDKIVIERGPLGVQQIGYADA